MPAMPVSPSFAAVLRCTLAGAWLAAAASALAAGAPTAGTAAAPAAAAGAQPAAPAAVATPLPAARPPADAACTAGNLRIAADGGFDYRRDKVLLLAVVIYECGSPLRIEAARAEASSLDFDNSTWTFTGAVKVRMAQGDLAADNATAKFTQQKLAIATFNGAPATFDQRAAIADLAAAEGAGAPLAGAPLASAVTAHGHARTIVYNQTPGEVQLIGDAWLSNGCNELSGDTVIYNLLQKSVSGPAATGPGGRVHGVIRPQCKPAALPGGAP